MGIGKFDFVQNSTPSNTIEFIGLKRKFCFKKNVINKNKLFLQLHFCK